jgi:hypothetical protein
MADEENNNLSGTGEGGSAAVAGTTATQVRLAHDPKIVRAKTVEEGGGFEKVYHTPPTISGEVNINGFGAIFLPSLEEQIAGFTPLKIAKKATVSGEAGEAVHFWFEKDSGEAARRVLLEQFPGIFKPVTEKGA